MKSFFSPLLNLALVVVVAFGLGGCVTTRLPVASFSPWESIELNTQANPLDLDFVDDQHGFLIGTNRLILETNDGGITWNERTLQLPEEENFRLISIDFKGNEGWIAGQPSLVMHSTDAGKNWTRLVLGSKLPGDPYLVTTKGINSAELATTAGAVYSTSDGGETWEGKVSDASGGVRDLRRGPEGGYVSVSSLGNFFATLEPGEEAWQPHQRASSKRVQSLGYQPNGELWMLSRGAEIRFNKEAGDVESWRKPVIPIINGYNYLDLAWDPNGTIWAAGGNGTLLFSNDDGDSWEIDPVGDAEPTNLIRILFDTGTDKTKGFVLGERGHLLRWTS
ncbi:photosynthesis system II assembly factor Ycf48 [Prochlorococcus sp. MIT 1300]|uniref:photosynthesis system II assembly factor Ycf48 n=1 Tax=Prochlorococcus sp. MIT 1300 TaxID=3096218 RepID=UPI002A74DEA2|nr:photosynthesis system II assembly factor Ycf48 [Prochlorococcus sp. MIT 1300]